MPLLLFSITLLFILWLFILAFYLKNTLILEKKKRVYLKVIKKLRQLFEHLPQHRGMANAFLQGDKNFKEKIEAMQNKIEADIIKIEDAFPTDSNNSLAKRWALIKSDWLKLKSDLTSLSPPNSFQRHTDLITEVIYLIGDSADISRVANTKESHISHLSFIVFTELPMMMEFIGRARGIGTGVASIQKTSVANRVKLGFLYKRIADAVESNKHTLSRVISRQTSLSAKQSLLMDSESATKDFIKILKSEFLDTHKIDIKPTEYYNIGTTAVSKNFALLDGLLPTIINHAETSHSLLLQKVKILIVSAIATSAVLAGFWLT